VHRRSQLEVAPNTEKVIVYHLTQQQPTDMTITSLQAPGRCDLGDVLLLDLV